MIGVCSYFQVKYVIKRADVEFKKSQIDKMEIAEKVADEYSKTVDSYNTVKVFTDTTHSDSVMLLTFIEDLETTLPSGSTIDDLECQDGYLTFTVYAPCKEAVADLIVQLKGKDYISDVNVSELEDKSDNIIITDQDINTFDVTKIDNIDEAKTIFKKQILSQIFNNNPYMDTDRIVKYEMSLKLTDKSFVAGEISLTDTSDVPSDDNSEGGEE